MSLLPRLRSPLPALALPIAALAIATALSGCAAWPLQAGSEPSGLAAADAGADWQRQACDPTRGGSPSGNAALAEGLRQPAGAIAAGLAKALGDPLLAPLGQDPERPEWSTAGGGRVAVALRGGEFAMALYDGPGDPQVDALHALLVDWGVDPATLWVGAGAPEAGHEDAQRLFQAELGWPAAWALGGLTWDSRSGRAQVALLPFYDVAAPQAPADEATASQVALAFAECDEDAGRDLGAELVGWGVLHGSLAYVAAVDLGQTHCGDRWVYVDAGSGVVLGAHSEPCIG